MTDLGEDPGERARRYITGFELTLHEVAPKKHDTIVKVESITRVTDAIQRYLQDARFYLENGKATTSLASIAYAEGLLDALTFLELVKTN